MALKATIFKVDLQISDMDRHFYQDFNLTLAQHPSETEERMMVRLLSFALHADENLQFTQSISAEDEADLWKKSLTDEIELWIEIGLPDEKRIKKACNRSQQVCLYTYAGRSAKIWWEKNKEKLSKHKNLKVIDLPQSATKELGQIVEKTMTLQCSIQDGQIWFSNNENSILIEPVEWKGDVVTS